MAYPISRMRENGFFVRYDEEAFSGTKIDLDELLRSGEWVSDGHRDISYSTRWKDCWERTVMKAKKLADKRGSDFVFIQEIKDPNVGREERNYYGLEFYSLAPQEGSE